jgi:ATP-binding cassette subfamily B protein
MARARWGSAIYQAAAWTLFGAAFVGAMVWVSAGLHAGAASVLLVLAAGGRLSQYVGAAVAEAGFLTWTFDASRRFLWLERYAQAHAPHATRLAPERLEHGIRLENVSFRYPGTESWVLRDITLKLPAGAVVAVVGENGAGKSTLVKLLCAFYAPTEGRICVDDADLREIPIEDWRKRIAGSFQDFFKFEFRAAQTVGLGDLPRSEQRPAVAAAVERAGAGDVIERLTVGLDTQLGPTWEDGVEVSFGQWQKLSLARGFMRDRPQLLVLDEPTAALDAETEHALFERYAAASRMTDHDGRVTVLVSHRFSTVRMADLIVVLDGNRVAECGSHDELMASGRQYAELYGIQAQAYR